MSGVVHAVGNFVHSVGQLFKPPSAPELKSPDALSSTPTQAQASATASAAQLSQEQAANSTSTVLNGGQGLLNDPTTTSSLLSGS